VGYGLKDREVRICCPTAKLNGFGGFREELPFTRTPGNGLSWSAADKKSIVTFGGYLVPKSEQ